MSTRLVNLFAFCVHHQPTLQIPRSAQPRQASFESQFGVTDVSYPWSILGSVAR